MPLDPATAALLAKFAESPAPPLHDMTPADARKVGAGLARLYGKGPEMSRVFEETLGPEGAQFTVRVLVPTAHPRAVVLYFHGGGWVIGSLDEYDTLGRMLAERLNSTVVLVDYRLAPENRFPAAVDDARVALDWANSRRTELARENAPLVVAGDSAGGNLAAVVTLADTAPPVAAQVLIYPVISSDFTTASYLDPENQLVLNRDGMIWFWDCYAPDVSSRSNADISPLCAEDLFGLPPAIVLTAEFDVLRDEGETYAARLQEAGVKVEHRRFDGQMHGFFSMVNLLPGSIAGLDYVVDRLEPYLDGTSA
jgi:acetyl esterase